MTEFGSIDDGRQLYPLDAKQMKKRIIIVGSGPGGLTSGMLLANRGYDVTILEKAPVIGGRNAALEVGDYKFDTGPTFLHQKFTLDEVFAETGRRSEDYMKFIKLDPMTRLTWTDRSMETSSDIDKMAANIELAFPGQAVNYRRFMRDHSVKLRTIYPCLLKPYQSLGAYFSTTLLKALPYVATTQTVMDVLSKYFDDDRLKLAFTFQAKYLGMSPWSCPALFSILSYIEYAHGIYHVEGGLSNISAGMAEVFSEEGGTLKLNTEVKTIQYNGKRATGVMLADGSILPCDQLIVNADYAYARSSIFGIHNESRESLLKKKYSCSTFMLYLGLDTIYQDEPHHHILFAEDYHKNVQDIQGERVPSEDMSIYVRNSSINDPTVAPEGHSQLYVLVPTINNRNGYSWDDNLQSYRDKVLDYIIAKTGMKDLREHIVVEKCITPQGWESANIFIGATFNLAHTMDQMLHRRPHNHLKGFDNIYLTGGGTHPGSGLPTIYESARISANLILQQDGDSRPPVDLATPILQGSPC